MSRWCPLMARLSSVVSEADDEEWGEDEEMVSTSSTEAVPEAIPSTGKKEVKICQLASPKYSESKCPNLTRVIVIEQKN